MLVIAILATSLHGRFLCMTKAFASMMHTMLTALAHVQNILLVIRRCCLAFFCGSVLMAPVLGEFA
jgi:hypothetical protein